MCVMLSNTTNQTTTAIGLHYVGGLLVTFGMIAMCKPDNIQNIAKNYTLKDLIRGWGIYATALGSILLAMEKDIDNTNTIILIITLLVSILWHADIVQQSQWTTHHIESILLNAIGLLILGHKF